jgi:hypothetical protein
MKTRNLSIINCAVTILICLNLCQKAIAFPEKDVQENNNQIAEPTTEASSDYGKDVKWYDCERKPKLYSGQLNITGKGYAFIVKANNTGEPKVFSISFYDEDAEKEAADIVEASKANNNPQENQKDENIQLLGYISEDDPNKIDVIYGIKIGEELVSPN